MTQVQTIGGLKRGRGRGRASGRGRGRGARGAGRSDKPAAFEAFKGSGFSLSAQQSGSNQQPANGNGSGVFAAEQQNLAGIAKLQQQHDEALALKAVQLAELQKQQQQQQQQQQQVTALQASASHSPASIPAQANPQLHANPSMSASDVIDLCDDDSDRPAHQSSKSFRPPAKQREKVSWSLGVDRATSGATASTSSASTDNPFWCPARYVPSGGENQADLRLQTHEVVHVLDSGLVGHRGTAVLDTGSDKTCDPSHAFQSVIVVARQSGCCQFGP